MPKEIVYDEATMYDLVVGWSTDGQYVQIGIQTHTGKPIVELLGAGEDRMTLAEFTGLWGTFDRDGLNRIIRAIKHARDKAYGKDE